MLSHHVLPGLENANNKSESEYLELNKVFKPKKYNTGPPPYRSKKKFQTSLYTQRKSLFTVTWLFNLLVFSLSTNSVLLIFPGALIAVPLANSNQDANHSVDIKTIHHVAS